MSKNKNYSRQTGNSAKIVAIVALLLSVVLAAYVVLSLVYHSWNPVRWTD